MKFKQAQLKVRLKERSEKRYMSTITEKRERIAALSDNFWLAVE